MQTSCPEYVCTEYDEKKKFKLVVKLTDSLPHTTVQGTVAESGNPTPLCTFTGQHLKRVWVEMTTFPSVFFVVCIYIYMCI